MIGKYKLKDPKDMPVWGRIVYFLFPKWLEKMIADANLRREKLTRERERRDRT